MVALLLVGFVLPTVGRAEVHLLPVESAIHPVSMRLIAAAVERAEDQNAEALIIELDTPGGLMESTRGITKAILNSRVPVIVWVGPEGARAGSAGVFITMAAHIAAMAPSTNIGAATPVGMGNPTTAPDSTEGSQSDAEAMRKKVTNDAIAQVRAMAERHGRNADWAEEAVREAASITSNEALELNVIDLIADDVEDLLQKVDGMTVETVDGEVTLATAGSIVTRYEMTWREKFLARLANPNLAYILLLIGFYGLIFELYNPGAVIPGVLGVIALILAFFAMQTLPLNWAGLLLLVVGIIMLLLEIKVASYGFLTFGGAVSLVLGSIMLFDSPIPALRVSWTVIIPTVGVTVLFFVFALTYGIRAQKNKVTTGEQGLVGEDGIAFEELNPTGRVKIGAEFWRAEAENPPIEKGDRIIVTGGDRLNLKVKRLS
ncbi:nodulation protein NfeD [bacterium]|nr:nodulation protein NfeD [bacterium]